MVQGVSVAVAAGAGVGEGDGSDEECGEVAVRAGLAPAVEAGAGLGDPPSREGPAEDGPPEIFVSSSSSKRFSST